jgi:DNA-binding response OmpR family regulator
MNTRLLVVEDDINIRKLLQSGLAELGFEVEAVSTGESAITSFRKSNHNAVLLDIGLGALSGIDVCREIRRDSNVPIIFITASDSPEQKISALEIGGDDYVTKPFHIGEIAARIRAIFRRTDLAHGTSEIIAIGDIEVDMSNRSVSLKGVPIHLTRLEFGLLAILAANPGVVLHYEELLKRVWGDGYSDVRPIHVHMCNLRRKLEPDPTGIRFIIAVPGMGYRFRIPDTTIR